MYGPGARLTLLGEHNRKGTCRFSLNNCGGASVPANGEYADMSIKGVWLRHGAKLQFVLDHKEIKALGEKKVSDEWFLFFAGKSDAIVSDN